MDPFTILVFLTLVMLIIGSITDIRWRIVPDWLSYSAIVVGFTIRAMTSVMTLSWIPFLEGLIGFGVFFILACVLFYTKMWGGGDSKVLMAMGVMLGVNLSIDNLMLGMMSNLLIVGGLYGVTYFLILGVMHFSKVSKAVYSLLSIKAVARTQVGVLFMLVLFFVASLFFKDFAPFVFGIGFVTIFYLFILSKAIEKSCFIKDQRPSLLEEGDWLIDPVIVKGKRLAGPEDPGITKKQIAAIQSAAKKRLIKTVRIKEGIPFIPNFLITFTVTLLWGNIVFQMMGLI